jgi:hypothetical protein
MREVVFRVVAGVLAVFGGAGLIYGLVTDTSTGFLRTILYGVFVVLLGAFAVGGYQLLPRGLRQRMGVHGPTD